MSTRQNDSPDHPNSEEFNSSKPSVPRVRGGKYLVFKLSGEEYGLEILKVLEIIGLLEITNIPRMPNFVRGVINLRGKVIPIIDLRKKFGMTFGQDTKHTCIIVVDVLQKDSRSLMGILVDTVSEVIDIDGSEIEESPSFGTVVDTSFIRGMGKVKGQVKILLDIDKVLSSEEFSLIRG